SVGAVVCWAAYGADTKAAAIAEVARIDLTRSVPRLWRALWRPRSLDCAAAPASPATVRALARPPWRVQPLFQTPLHSPSTASRSRTAFARIAAPRRATLLPSLAARN